MSPDLADSLIKIERKTIRVKQKCRDAQQLIERVQADPDLDRDFCRELTTLWSVLVEFESALQAALDREELEAVFTAAELARDDS